MHKKQGDINKTCKKRVNNCYIFESENAKKAKMTILEKNGKRQGCDMVGNLGKWGGKNCLTFLTVYDKMYS